MQALVETLTSAAGSARDRFDLWIRIVRELHPTTMLEIGVWKGAFAAQILANCDSLREYSMLDSWRKLAGWNKPWNVSDESFEDVYAQALKATEFAAPKRRILRGTTTEVIDRVADESQDLVYVDGDHTLRGVIVDLVNAFPKVRPGGFLAGDDFIPSIWRHGGKYEPTLVFPTAAYFAEAVGAAFFALPFDQFLMAKSMSGRTFTFTDLSGKGLELNLRDQMGFGRALARGLRSVLGLR